MIELANRPDGTADSAHRQLLLAATGDDAAWAELVRTRSGVIWSIIRAYRVSDAAAGDVYQAVWLRLVENVHRIRDPQRLSGWLATTTRRECLKVIEKAARLRYDAALADRADGAPSPEELYVRGARNRIVSQAIEGLPARDKRLLRILMSDPKPDYRNISTTLGMPLGSIGPTRARALGRLRCELAKLGITEYAQIA